MPSDVRSHPSNSLALLHRCAWVYWWDTSQKKKTKIVANYTFSNSEMNFKKFSKMETNIEGKLNTMQNKARETRMTLWKLILGSFFPKHQSMWFANVPAALASLVHQATDIKQTNKATRMNLHPGNEQLIHRDCLIHTWSIASYFRPSALFTFTVPQALNTSCSHDTILDAYLAQLTHRNGRAETPVLLVSESQLQPKWPKIKYLQPGQELVCG